MDNKVDSFSSRLNLILNERNIKPAELAKGTNISKSSISEYLTGKFTPKEKNISKIANFLNVNMYWLMGYDVSKNASSMIVYGQLNQLLYKERNQRGLSIAEVSNSLLIEPSDLLSYENGNKLPSLEELQKFSNLYNYPLDTLKEYALNYTINEDDNSLVIDLNGFSKEDCNFLLKQIEYIRYKNQNNL